MKKRIGATGRYPQGRYTNDDEGELAIAVAADPRNRIVRIEFGKPVAWLAFNPEQAETFGRMLIAKARATRGEPLEGDAR